VSPEDACLVTLLNRLRPAGFDVAWWPRLKAYRARLRERPSVRAALGAEGILKHWPPGRRRQSVAVSGWILGVAIATRRP